MASEGEEVEGKGRQYYSQLMKERQKCQQLTQELQVVCGVLSDYRSMLE